MAGQIDTSNVTYRSRYGGVTPAGVSFIMTAISRNNIDYNNDNIIYDNRRNNQIRLSDRELARDDHEIANNILLTAINCKITILYYNNKACVVLAEREASEDKIQSQ